MTEREMTAFEEYTLAQLARAMTEVRAQMDLAKSQETRARELWDALRKRYIPEKMEEMGVESVKLTGIGRVSLRTDAYCSTPSDHKEALFEWMREHGHGDLITDTINGSTLKAFVKEQVIEGEEIPDDIINFEPYTYAAITRG